MDAIIDRDSVGQFTRGAKMVRGTRTLRRRQRPKSYKGNIEGCEKDAQGHGTGSNEDKMDNDRATARQG